MMRGWVLLSLRQVAHARQREQKIGLAKMYDFSCRTKNCSFQVKYNKIDHSEDMAASNPAW